MPNPQPGDLVFVHSSGFIGKCIRLGEYLRFRDGRFWNHVAIVSDLGDASDPLIIQAVARGVTETAPLSTVAPGGSYEVVTVPDTDLDFVLDFAKAQVGASYGFLTIVSLALRILCPKFLPLPSVRFSSSWICSALGAESARFGGWLHDWPDVYQVVPSELFAAIHGIGVRDVASFSHQATQPAKELHQMDNVSVPGLNWANIVKALSLHGAAILASALAVANTDLTRLEDFVLAVAPTFVAGIFTAVRGWLKKV